MNAKKVTLIAAIITAVFMILPLRYVIKTVKMKNHGVLTEGEVTGRDNHGKGLARVTVIFSTDKGKEITATAQKRDFVKMGDKVKLWYDPAKPQEIDFGDTISYNMRGVLVVGLISLFLFYLFIKSSLKDAANKKLIDTGLKVSAELVSVGRNEKYRMGDKNPWVINCKWTDSNNNKEYRFVSKDYTIDPTPFMSGRSHIDVYIDPADPGKFFMDTSFVPSDKNFVS